MMKKNGLTIGLVLGLMLAGCAKEENPERVTEVVPVVEVEQVGQEESNVSSVSKESLAEYMGTIEEQSEAIRTYLEEEAMTQDDMNVKSQELYELWDGALNYLWDELKNSLPEEELTSLTDEQLAWIEAKEKAVEEAGKEFEGGSIYPLIVNDEAARITKERVYELYELFD